MNNELQQELLAMKEADLKIRQKLVDNGQLFNTRYDYHPEMKEIHQKNNKRIREIIIQYGWPGFSLVGKDGCEAAGLIVQHAVLEPEFQEHCLELLEIAVLQKEAHPWMYALLLDRVLVHQGKKQRYGSQHFIDKNGKLIPYPIENEKNVDALRQHVGLGSIASRSTEMQKERDEAKK
jgi:hypothetical protein